MIPPALLCCLIGNGGDIFILLVPLSWWLGFVFRVEFHQSSHQGRSMDSHLPMSIASLYLSCCSGSYAVIVLLCLLKSISDRQVAPLEKNLFQKDFSRVKVIPPSLISVVVPQHGTLEAWVSVFHAALPHSQGQIRANGHVKAHAISAQLVFWYIPCDDETVIFKKEAGDSSRSRCSH